MEPAEHVSARVRELGLRAQDVVSRSAEGSPNGGFSESGYFALLKPGKIASARDSTKRDLERALQWANGSIDDILSGGQPTVIAQSDVTGDDDLNARILQQLEAQEAVTRQLVVAIADLQEELRLSREARGDG